MILNLFIHNLSVFQRELNGKRKGEGGRGVPRAGEVDPGGSGHGVGREIERTTSLGENFVLLVVVEKNLNVINIIIFLDVGWKN